jgi:sodium/potassium-transporting ATPase subunit alpha
VDEWEKVEEEEEWDPDFDEFDIPKSKTKKPPTTGTKKGAKGVEEEDLGIDEEFKDLDLFNDSGFDEEEDDF